MIAPNQALGTTGAPAHSMTPRHPFLLAVPLTILACARPAPGTRAHDDSTTGHRQSAATHQAEADRTLVFTGSKAYYENVHRDHQRLATAHLRAAEQLDADYDATCAGRSPSWINDWPAVSTTDTVSDGVVLHVVSDSDAHDEVLARLLCHRAALARDGFARFPDDPLAIDRLELVVHAEPGGTAVMLGVAGAEQVEDLQRRVRAIIRPE